MTIKDLLEKRAKAVADARAITEKADKEARELTAEEKQQFDALMNQADGLRVQVEQRERVERAEREIREAGGRTAPADAGAGAPEGDSRVRPRATPEYREQFRRFIVSGVSALREQEVRALQADSDILGGYMTPSEQFVAELIAAIKNEVFIRAAATVLPLTTADSLGVPTLDTDVSDADWTSEILTGSEDSSMRVGKRQLQPHPLAKRIKLSNKLMRVSAIEPEALVRDRLTYKFAVTEEKAYMTGSGSGQPLGVFTASGDGISTGRDISDGNTTTSIQFDGLYNAKYAIKGGYWPRANWIFHRDGLKQIAKLKDGEGRYLWTQSVREGEPDRLLGFPLRMSEYAPNTFTTGLYVGILGDFKQYWIAESLAMTVQRLVELYAETNQIGFIGRLELDGMPVLEEAFARVKLA